MAHGSEPFQAQIELQSMRKSGGNQQLIKECRVYSMSDLVAEHLVVSFVVPQQNIRAVHTHEGTGSGRGSILCASNYSVSIFFSIVRPR